MNIETLRISKRDLMKSIIGTECPCCEAPKLDGCLLCQNCYTKLPIAIKTRIANSMRGLSESIRAGIEFLQQ